MLEHTANRLLRIPPGRELDGEIHHFLTGFGLNKEDLTYQTKAAEKKPIPHYSTDDNDAYNLKFATVPQASIDLPPIVAVTLELDGKKYRGEGSTVAYAMCRALISWKGGLPEGAR